MSQGSSSGGAASTGAGASTNAAAGESRSASKAAGVDVIDKSGDTIASYGADGKPSAPNVSFVNDAERERQASLLAQKRMADPAAASTTAADKEQSSSMSSGERSPQRVGLGPEGPLDIRKGQPESTPQPLDAVATATQQAKPVSKPTLPKEAEREGAENAVERAPPGPAAKTQVPDDPRLRADLESLQAQIEANRIARSAALDEVAIESLAKRRAADTAKARDQLDKNRDPIPSKQQEPEAQPRQRPTPQEIDANEAKAPRRVERDPLRLPPEVERDFVRGKGDDYYRRDMPSQVAFRKATWLGRSLSVTAAPSYKRPATLQKRQARWSASPKNAAGRT
jgi:hypothetical protein